MPTLNARQINGVVRTSEPVWRNLERLAEAAGVWFTYDTHNGVYAWVINEAGNSVASISEADIVGPIQIAGSGLTNLYNSVEIEYPRNDIRDQPHYVTVELPAGLRNAYEPDNTLQMTSEFINNQPQAEYVAMVTLKQSRLDRTVTINMDYTKINLQAGDIIDITSPTYGWTAKEFRIMRVREIEGDDGSLRLEFTCSEYDDTIYDGTWNNFLVGGQPGIISIGSIGQPGTPTITIANVNSLPTMQVTSTVPTGIVDRMQFWAGNVLITGNVANTTFNLYGTVASSNANAFTANSNAVFNTTNITDGTWAWKTRGVNGSGNGPFSNVSANLTVASGNVISNVVANSNAIINSANTGAVANSIINSTYVIGGIIGSPTFGSKIGTLLTFDKEISLGVSTGNVLPYYYGGNAANVTTSNLAFYMPANGNITLDMYANFGNTGNAGNAKGLHRIDCAIFTGNTFGSGNIAPLSTSSSNAWVIATSQDNVDAFQDLYVRQSGFLESGYYHIEPTVWANVSDVATFNIQVNTISGNFYTS